MRISDWSSDVCSSDLEHRARRGADRHGKEGDRDIEDEALQQQRCPVEQGGEGGTPGLGGSLRLGQAGGEEEQRQQDTAVAGGEARRRGGRSEEHTSELQSLMRISYAVFCLKKRTERSRLTTASPTHSRDRQLTAPPS